MAQYYQIVGQDSAIQAVTLEELRQYYPSITCVESSAGVQYVINQEDGGTQFQSQQVLLTADQQIVLNSGDATQQIIVDQSHIAYQTTGQQFTVHENEVADYSSVEISNTQQQVYFANASEVKSQPQPQPQQQPIIQATPSSIMNQQLTPRQITSPIVNSPQQTVAPTIPQTPTRIITEQLSNAHLLTPCTSDNAVSTQQATPPQQPPQPSQTQPQVVSPSTISRQITTNSEVRLQYGQQIVQEQTTSGQTQIQMEDDSQLVLNDGRMMTLGQYKQELAQSQQENITVHGTQVTPPVVANCIDKSYKTPVTKRSTKRVSTPSRGKRGRGRGGATASPAASPLTRPDLSIQSPKPFHQLNNKPVAQYSGQHKTLQANNPVKQMQQVMQRQIQQIHAQPNPVLQQQEQQRQLAMQQATVVQRGLLQHGLQQPQQPVSTDTQQLEQVKQLEQQQVQQLEQQQIQQQQIQQQQLHQQIQQQQQLQQQQLQQQQLQRQPQPAGFSHNGHVQPLIPLAPLVNQNGVFNTAEQPVMSEDYKDSARMLVCLESGEQRLITFTLPKDTCTVQDLLEQVGVPFTVNTKIECIANPGNEIDYIVHVGAVSNAQYPIDPHQISTVNSLAETEETPPVQPCVSPVQKEVIPEPPPKEPSPERPPEPPKEMPKFIPGMLAVCNHCGYLSEDFNRCQRCKTKLPEDVKRLMAKAEPKLEDKRTDTRTITVSSKPPGPKPTAKLVTANAKTGAKPPRGKKPKAQDAEPVVLTLSSDDEEGPSHSQNGNPNTPGKLPDSSITQSVILKEPVIKDYLEFEKEALSPLIECNGKEDELRLTSRYSTMLSCRTVRVGSYKFYPKEEIAITSLGVKIVIPMIKNPEKSYRLFIPIKYIIKVLACFNKSLPVLFLYVTPSIGTLVRSHLEMEDGSEYYFDPLSKEESFKRITLLPENIVEEVRTKIKDIFLNKPYKMLEELTSKEANDILLRTCPRESSVLKLASNSQNSSTELRQLLIYPPGKGGIAINTEDYLCLAQDQFLNDVIIDFYLKYVATTVIKSSMHDKVYIFSSFFYKRLTTKPAKAPKRSVTYETDPSLSAAEKRHARVKNWTKHVNIFEKDFIIIPINENSHWFLAIICYPGLDGCRSMIDEEKVVKIPGKKVKKKKEEKKLDNIITIGNTTITIKTHADEKAAGDKPIKCEEEEASDRDEAEGDESELEEEDTDSDMEDVQLGKKKAVREPIKQACILIFDSLSGAGRSRVVATLRDYLTCEYKAKMHTEKVFTKDVIKGACPKVPQQTNFTDCGLYVLQYVEAFFKDPIKDFHIPIKQLKNWFEEIVVTRKREDISNLIKELMVLHGKDTKILPDIAFPTVNGELVNSGESSFVDPEDDYTEMPGPEEQESNSPEKMETSLVGDMYNSDSSGESSNKQSEINAQTEETSPTSFEAGSIKGILKSGLIDFQKKSNRDTMSYLKSKRISRHKNNESTNELKKQKLDD